MKKNKIIFCGDLTQNNGPANVNKSLKKYFNYTFIDTKSKKRIYSIFCFFKYLPQSSVVIFSSNYRINNYLFRIAHLFRKKTIYLMHGYSGYETVINKTKNPNRAIKLENYILKHVSVILIVSERYKDWFLEQRPEYKHKTHFLTNGIDIEIFNNIKIKKENESKVNNDIVVCGANRIIKGNDKVAQAVSLLNKENHLCNLAVYGYMYPKGVDITENESIKVYGRVSQEELYRALSKSKLFVLNSLMESFGLSVIDALMCGCNILVTKNAGITSIMTLENNDIIFDPNNIDEIKEKIKYNLKHNNNERILKSIDFEHYSWQNVAKRLEIISERLINNKDFKDVR